MPLANPAPTVGNPLQTVNTLPTLGDPKQLAVSSSSARQALTAGVKRISILADGCDTRYALGDNTVTANSATSHLIKNGERLEFLIDATLVAAGGQVYVAAIAKGGSGVGALEISELG